MSNVGLDPALARRVARLLREALEKGASIEIDGLGKLLPGGKAGFQFHAQAAPRVFIAYVAEDLAIAKRLYRAFELNGFRPWLDKKRLVPGQNWPRAIETAIQTSDFFVACFSRRATAKRGSFHSELRYALHCAEQVPLDEIFLIPLRLDDTPVPRRIARQVQYLDLFPEWDTGIKRVIHTMKVQDNIRKQKLLSVG